MNRRQQVLSWWQGRERREQWMLAVMGACLLAFLYWYALMLPLRALRDEALAGRQRAGADLALVQARLQAMQAMQATPPRQAEPPTAEQLPALLASTAASAGIELAAPVAQADGSVLVRIDAAPAATVLAWLEALRVEHALGPEQVNLDPAEGGIRAQLVFRGASHRLRPAPVS